MDEATARYRVIFADEAAEKLRVEQEAAQKLKSEMEAAAEALRDQNANEAAEKLRVNL